MKILAVSFFTPYKENYKGISALLYSLLKYRSSDVEVVLYSYNANHLPIEKIYEVEREIGIKIRFIPFPLWIQKLMRIPILFKVLELLLPESLYSYIAVPNEIKDKIKSFEPDVVWLYPFFFYRWASKLKKIKFVITGCDNNALFYERCLDDAFFKSKKKHIGLLLRLYKAYWIEKKFAKKNIMMHYVGQEDMSSYMNKVNIHNAFFSVHPHNCYISKDIHFSSHRIRVVIAGNNDFYMISNSKKIIEELSKNELLPNFVEITFLGKGWNTDYLALKDAGYACDIITWVDNYNRELIKYDVQLVPISVGTGTKGKVLDALVNGLLCIGTPCAMENVFVENGKSCIIYNNPEDIPAILLDISLNRKKYEEIAENGRSMILEKHSPLLASDSFYANIANFLMKNNVL